MAITDKFEHLLLVKGAINLGVKTLYKKNIYRDLWLYINNNTRAFIMATVSSGFNGNKRTTMVILECLTKLNIFIEYQILSVDSLSE